MTAYANTLKLITRIEVATLASHNWMYMNRILNWTKWKSTNGIQPQCNQLIARNQGYSNCKQL